MIDLLSTSTTLAKNRGSYETLSRFVLWLMLWVTVAHAVLATTPLFDLVVKRWLSIPPNVADVIRPGLIIMIPWSACIGWRRYLQGILIRFGQTRLVGMGTIVRLAAVSTSGILLYKLAHLSGVELAATALVTSVFCEALFAHFASRKTIRDRLSATTSETQQPDRVSMRQLIKFHMPLTATTMVMFLGGPLVSATLAQSSNSVLALAAWQVCVTVLFLLRTVVYALPEVVITLARGADAAAMLSKFCATVGLVASTLILLLAATRVDVWFFVQIMNTDATTAERAHLGFFAGAAMPLIGALQSYVRGMLTAHHLTASRLFAVIVAIAALAIALPLLLLTGIHGVLVAAFASTFSLLAELIALVVVWRRGSARLAFSPGIRSL